MAVLIAVGLGSQKVQAQAPTIDMPEPPGVPGGRGKLGPAIGASGTASLENPSNLERPIGGRPGPSVSRAPVGGLMATSARVQEPSMRLRSAVGEAPAAPPTYGDLEIPEGPEDLGPADGLTLDQAIALLIQRNLSLIALRYEIPMADADVLTASLRANPIFYADSQLIPYGHYSNARPGGQTQYDINVTYPLDVTRKRKARTEVARRARRVTEAQLQDAIRLQIDNLYTEYVDLVAADETLRFMQANARGLDRLYEYNQKLFRAGTITQAPLDDIRARVERSQLQLRQAKEALVTAKRDLALILDMPRDQADRMEVRAALRDVRDLPAPDESLISEALERRPDLMAQRLGVERAGAEIRLAESNRYPDVYLLYQPYTLQDNRPLGLKSPYSWAVGVTATLPVYNRNQGNIARARLNHTQTRVEQTALERQIAHEVETTIREFRLSRTSILELEREVIPAARRVRDEARGRYEVGEESPIYFIEAQRNFNEVVREYRDALVKHRRAMLDLNTAVGSRILP